MRLVILGIAATTLASGASQAQGNWQPQASPSILPVYHPVPTDLPPPIPQCGPKSPNKKDCSRPVQPKGTAKLWVTLNDYPTRALRERLEGKVKFKISVGVDGRPKDCTITRSSGLALFDDTTCQLVMRRARFYPALDKNGELTTGTWKGEMDWKLPSE